MQCWREDQPRNRPSSLMIMLTTEQQKWIDHLSDTDTVAVIPFDPTCEEKYIQAKNSVQNFFGKGQEVLHRGASALKISGQDEIDVYVPVPLSDFNQASEKMKTIFGDPKSFYPSKRARFVAEVAQKHVDVFVINREDANWLDSEKFHSHLLSHPTDLEAYRKLKEESAGQSVREYYRRKTEFINEILAKIG